jgi:hypothetical protein
MVSARILTIDLVVAAHDRAWLRALDRDLEGEQVGLAVRVGIDDRVQPVAVGLVAVERVVLERRDHYATALSVATSRKNSALSFGVRLSVFMSTRYSPNFGSTPNIHSTLSIVLQWNQPRTGTSSAVALCSSES